MLSITDLGNGGQGHQNVQDTILNYIAFDLLLCSVKLDKRGLFDSRDVAVLVR